MINRLQKILIAVILIGGFCFCNYYEHHYTRTDCVVYEATDEGILVEDKCGFTWFIDNETLDYKQYEIGNIVDMKLHTNYTISDIEDDIPLKIVKVD